jgi:membrane protease YdiL (CAAX protease family)
VTESALPVDPAEIPPVIPTDPASPRQTARWRWWIHLIVLGAYPLLGLLASLATGRASRGPALSGRAAGLVFVSVSELLFFSILFGLAWLASRATREELMWRWRPGWAVVPLGVAYSIVIRLGLVIVAVVVMAMLAASQVVTPEKVREYVNVNRPDIESMVSVPAMRHDPAYYWLTLTLVSFVVAGLREEMWRAGTLAGMRALWPRAFRSPLGQCVAMALIAVAFGAMHLRMGTLAAVGAGVLGLFLGLIIVLHKSIWPAVIAHGLFDATTLALLPWWLEKARHLQGQ